jgi:hypothetical protein
MSEMIDKSAIHNLIFGTLLPKIYGTLIDSKVASLDTLYGGLTPESWWRINFTRLTDRWQNT